MAQRVHATRLRIRQDSTLSLVCDPAIPDSFVAYDGLHRLEAGSKVRVAARRRGCSLTPFFHQAYPGKVLEWPSVVYPQGTPVDLLLAIGLANNQSMLMQNAFDASPSGQLRSVLQQVVRFEPELQFPAFSKRVKVVLPTNLSVLGVPETVQPATLAGVLYPVYLKACVGELLKEVEYERDVDGVLKQKDVPLTFNHLLEDKGWPSAALAIGDAVHFLEALRAPPENQRSIVKELFKAYITKFFDVPTYDKATAYDVKDVILGIAPLALKVAKVKYMVPDEDAMFEIIEHGRLNGERFVLMANEGGIMDKAIEAVKKFGNAATAGAGASGAGAAGVDSDAGLGKRNRSSPDKYAPEDKRSKRTKAAGDTDKQKDKGKGKASEAAGDSSDDASEDDDDKVHAAADKGFIAVVDAHGDLIDTKNLKGDVTSDKKMPGSKMTMLKAAELVVGSGVQSKPNVIPGRLSQLLTDVHEGVTEEQGGTVEWYQNRNGGPSDPLERVTKNVLMTKECAERRYTVRVARFCALEQSPDALARRPPARSVAAASARTFRLPS